MHLEKVKFKSVMQLDHSGFGVVLSAIMPKKETITIKNNKNQPLLENIEELIRRTLQYLKFYPSMMLLIYKKCI